MNAKSVPPTIISPAFRRVAAMIAASHFLVLHAYSAQDAPAPQTPVPEQTAIKDQARDVAEAHPGFALADHLASLQRSSRFTGLSVRDPNTHRLGQIRDLLVDLHSGQLVCALVEPRSRGGLLVAIPAETFTGADDTRAVLKCVLKNLDGAPRFSSESPDPSVLVQAINDSYVYFGAELRRTLSPGPHQFSKFSKLTGRRVTNNAGEDLGRITDLMIDLPTGRIVFAALALDAKGHNLYAVPPGALEVQSDAPDIVLKADRAKVADLAPYNDFFWANLSDPAHAQQVYAAFGETPGDSSHADRARENVRARIDTANSAEKDAGRASEPSDSQITQSILTAIVRDEVNHFPVRAIRVVTVNGRVTLSGQVENEGQKRKLDSFASKLVGAENVDNQLKAGR